MIIWPYLVKWIAQYLMAVDVGLESRLTAKLINYRIMRTVQNLLTFKESIYLQ